jgi:hypothetical protein
LLTSVILATQETEIGRNEVQDKPGQKIIKIPISAEKSWVWWQEPVIPAAEGSVK